MGVSEGTAPPAGPTPRAGWYRVRHDAPAAKCRLCPAIVYYIRTVNGKNMPIHCDVDGGIIPRVGHYGEPDVEGYGVVHMATCPGWKHLSKRRAVTP